MNEELKPCLCGSNNVHFDKSVMYVDIPSPSSIRCRDCGLMIAKMGRNSDEYVLSKWNTRPLEDALTAERDKLQRQLSIRDYKYVELAGIEDEMIAERNALKAKLEQAKALLQRVAKRPADMYIILADEAVELLNKLEERNGNNDRN